MNLNLAAIIFDMDGVIVDSEPLHLRAWQANLREFGVEYTENDHHNFLGRKDIYMAGEICRKFKLPLSDLELVHRKETAYLNLLQQHAIARPGALSILNYVREVSLPCALASSATIPTIKLTMKVLAIENYFQSITSGDEVGSGKPSPDIFLLAAKRLQVEPSACLVVEDTLNGIRAAKRAGMYCVGIPCEATANQDHSEADQRLASLDELVALLSNARAATTQEQLTI